MNARRDLVNEMTEDKLRIIELEERFRHYHVANTDGPGGPLIDDSCAQCGLDLRDRVHHMDRVHERLEQK